MPPSARTTLRQVFVIDALRTPIGRVGGSLSAVRADDLAALVIASLAARQPACAERLDHVVMGCTNQAGEDNRNVARMAALLAGLPYDVPGVTVNRLCGSGLEAVADAARMIAVGEAECVIAGGVESMTRAPYVMAKPDQPFARGTPEVYDSALGWRFPNPRMRERFELMSMGETAENVAKKHAIGRADQDAFAVRSHQLAAQATAAGLFADELVEVVIPQRRGEPLTVRHDESIRADTSLDKLARLPAVFREGGTVTAGNSSPLNDGAAALLLVSGDLLQRHELTAMARVMATATVGLDPSYMGEGPILAVRKLLERVSLRTPNIDLFELNEAFAAQALACVRALRLDDERVNVHGGALALGHPIGCSGARVAVTLVHAMRARQASLGVASLCIGVGQGIAMLLERAS